ncbi:hypothetical protein PENANT_c008G11590 [Penicillium antarcticum]|uniref:CFEM domain-containing protein n=1 Tax=Penicillium antarcticum TaxID=416450 RepID=A0A1V6QAX7_9EURO|nr:uncharacterized protein N7508_007263 [Penicillium antarcticum]KAJ5302400.1 hypothetical protein N7508_007263 [Penicillium antarcticum]OQD86370.1 hypothetical protein PENANT_c008G11590 [Penicillium antarcticum]
MKTLTLISLFGVATLAHPAGLWWGTDICYTSPENTDNHCSDVQQTGFDWSELADGDNWGYDGFDFVGFTPKNGCGAMEENCIGGKLSRDDDYTLKVDASDAPFSIRNFHLTTSRQTDVILTYRTPEGHACHQVVSSSPDGVNVQNDQCGGAVSVDFQLPEESKFGECELNIHQVNFDCSAGEKPPGHPVPSPSQSYPESMSTPATVHVTVHESTSSTPEVSLPTRTPEITTSTVWTTAEFTVTSCAPTVTDCPAHSTAVVTSTYVLSTTVCPSQPTETGPLHSIGWGTTSAEISYESSHISIPDHPPAVTSKAGEPSSSAVPSEPIPSSPSTHAPCPELVPKCMNTWLSIPKCDSNSDAACFCPSSEFTDKVTSCIHSWGKSNQEIQSGLSYFAGICAPYVPKNPAIVDIVPTSTLPGPVTKPSVPSQVVAITSTPVEHLSAATTAPHTPCTTITWSSHTVTVPQVGFSTVTGSSSTTVDLILITPTATVWSHTSYSSSTSTMTTQCKTTTHSLSTTAASKPTETIVASNSGSRSGSPSPWAFGVAIVALALC